MYKSTFILICIFVTSLGSGCAKSKSKPSSLPLDSGLIATYENQNFMRGEKFRRIQMIEANANPESQIPIDEFDWMIQFAEQNMNSHYKENICRFAVGRVLAKSKLSALPYPQKKQAIALARDLIKNDMMRSSGGLLAGCKILAQFKTAESRQILMSLAGSKHPEVRAYVTSQLSRS